MVPVTIIPLWPKLSPYFSLQTDNSVVVQNVSHISRHIFKIKITDVCIITTNSSILVLTRLTVILTLNSLRSGLILTLLWSWTCCLSNLFPNSLAIWFICWFVMHNWVTILFFPLYGAMLLLAFNIFEYENWLVDKKYIFLTHFLMCLHSSRTSLKYRLST